MDQQARLVFRMKEGLGSHQYKAADYDKLKLQAAEKKIAAQRSLFKVKKITELSKQGKENQALKQHHLVWQQEFIRLAASRKRQQHELDAHLRQAQQDPELRAIFSDFDELQSDLGADLAEFKGATADPLWNLREDLKYWLVENSSDAQKGDLDTRDTNQVKDTVRSVTDQQTRIMADLRAEQLKLEAELKMGELSQLSQPTKQKIEHGIPEAAFDLESPNHELKVQILQEFIELDETYWKRLEVLDDTHSTAGSTAGDWEEEDHAVFMSLMDQYPRDMHHRRQLITDRLKRHLPHKTKLQLSQHEDLVVLQRYHQERRKALISDWLKDRAELLDKAKAVLAEACLEHDKAAAREEDLNNQKLLCDRLFQQVRDWQEQKAEVAALEEELERRRREEEAVREAKVHERDTKKRHQDRARIRSFHEVEESKKRVQEQRDRKRLEQLKRMLEEQAKIDKERVRYREVELEKKMEEAAAKQEEKEREEEERERRLEALREQVRPSVEFDPMRMHGDTEAWKQRLKKDEEGDNVNIQKPLFDIHTYNSKQIFSDPRVRLEQQLRAAGIHTNDYARQALARMPPLQPPRRDTHSTAFKHLQQQ